MASDTANRLLRQQLGIGVFQMLVCCVMGFMGGFALDKRALSGSHHQFAHNGELQIAIALTIPHLHLSDFMLRILSVLLTLGTWANPVAYFMVALSGQRNGLLPFTASSPDGDWGKASEVLLMTVCAPCILLALVLVIVGLVAPAVQTEKQD
eukprot:gb/GEZN01027803.1/.p1 GENE.gb/GEZN01027803.1/~~gb/GEZN01027803.1/.p1  ORF type:complete len:152 (+),score=3.30 gb/GEZN01027803.1/:3-458(+)